MSMLGGAQASAWSTWGTKGEKGRCGLLEKDGAEGEEGGYMMRNKDNLNKEETQAKNRGTICRVVRSTYGYVPMTKTSLRSRLNQPAVRRTPRHCKCSAVASAGEGGKAH